MAQWGIEKQANNSALFAPTSVKLAPNTANRDDLYTNTTPDAFIDNVTVGQFGYNEVDVIDGKVAHTGWVLVTEGSGGRAGRVQTEVLVAGRIAGPVITITGQPTDQEVDPGDPATFTVTATITNSSMPLTYQWFGSEDGVEFEPIAGANAATLTVSDSVTYEDWQYYVEVSSVRAPTVTSNIVTLTLSA